MTNTEYLVVGEYRRRPTEGMQALTTDLVDGLVRAKKRVDVCSPYRFLCRLPKLLVDPPAAVVFTHGPGPGVFAYSALLHRLTESRIIWFAPRPAVGAAGRLLTLLTNVDVVVAERLVPELKAILSRCNGRYAQLVHGIDRETFRPADTLYSSRIDRTPRSPLLLHVGHLRRNRGLTTLASVKRRIGNLGEVQLIASPAFRADRTVARTLRQADVKITTGYVVNLADYYRAASLYIFPAAAEERGAIDLPLSVLEALACGTPVLSTRFGSLPEVFGDFRGVRFAETREFPDLCWDFLHNPETVARPDTDLPAEYDRVSLARRFLAVLEIDGTA